jgi:uncharacterized repeat protein (TIGR03803 family)
MQVMKHASILAAAVVIASAIGASAQETVLHSFNNNDGNSPGAALVFDGKGNLFGTTFYGGLNGVGTVYQLNHTGSEWKEKVLYSFNVNGIDGYYSNASIIFDKAGNIYGTTFLGGIANRGTVFELSPSSGGGWTETVLHNFLNNGVDGTYPQSGVVLDAAGNLYGTASSGAANGYGMVYELSPSTGGGWTQTILYNFDSTNGANPYGTPVFDAAGNLYGTASAGGGTSPHCAIGCGTIFELSPGSNGWTEKVLHNFTTNTDDGSIPYSALVFDAVGNLYGTTLGGGAYGNNGTVFELIPTAGGLWREKILHSFLNNGVDGRNTMATPVFDAAGNLYCTTEQGGTYRYGTVFELSPTTTGPWKETILYNFNPVGRFGFDPAHGVALDSAGNLYGTTVGGGDFAFGTVYEITP